MHTDLVDSIANGFGFGDVLTPPERVSGGLLNEMWRFVTANGVFAVKVLAAQPNRNLWRFRYDDAFALERSSLAAGIKLPEPVANPLTNGPILEAVGAGGETGYAIAHHWVDAAPVPPGPVTLEQAETVGKYMGVVHGLPTDFAEHTRGMTRPPTVDDWQRIAVRCNERNLEWADSLLGQVEALGSIAEFIDSESVRQHELVFSHRDVNQKNLLADTSHLYLIDWETADHIAIAHELGATAMSIASHGHASSVDVRVASAFMSGYRSAGGRVPEVDSSWLVTWFASYYFFLYFNVERCISPGTGDAVTQKRASEIVTTALRELPDAFAHLDDDVESLRRASRC